MINETLQGRFPFLFFVFFFLYLGYLDKPNVQLILLTVRMASIFLFIKRFKNLLSKLSKQNRIYKNIRQKMLFNVREIGIFCTRKIYISNELSTLKSYFKRSKKILMYVICLEI